jgi:sulfonate transport system substrate-binding protein
MLQLLGGFDPVVIWQSVNLNSRAVVIVVRKDSPIKSLAELKGKSFASSRYTCPYFAAFETLKVHGVPLDTRKTKGEVRYVNMASANGQSLSLLLAGKVEAMSVFPTIVAVKDGLVREIATAEPNGAYVLDRSVQLSPRKWVNENPDLVRAYIKVYNKTKAWIQQHPEEAARLASPILRQPEELILFQLKEPGNTVFTAQETDYEKAAGSAKQLQQLAVKLGDDLFIRQQLTDAQIDHAFDRRFFRGGAFYAGDPEAVTNENASER